MFVTLHLWKILEQNCGVWRSPTSKLSIMSEELLRAWEKKSGDRQKLYKNFLHRADKNTVLKALPDLHEEAFSKIDCLQCANCCKNYSPRFKTPDIKRISKVLGLRESDFIDKYLR